MGRWTHNHHAIMIKENWHTTSKLSRRIMIQAYNEKTKMEYWHGRSFTQWKQSPRTNNHEGGWQKNWGNDFIAPPPVPNLHHRKTETAPRFSTAHCSSRPPPVPCHVSPTWTIVSRIRGHSLTPCTIVKNSSLPIHISVHHFQPTTISYHPPTVKGYHLHAWGSGVLRATAELEPSIPNPLSWPHTFSRCSPIVLTVKSLVPG